MLNYYLHNIVTSTIDPTTLNKHPVIQVPTHTSSMDRLPFSAALLERIIRCWCSLFKFNLRIIQVHLK